MRSVGLERLIDVDVLEKLFKAFGSATGITACIFSLDGRLLAGSVWQKICSDFHRNQVDSLKLCIQNDMQIQKKLLESDEQFVYQCPHGLIEAATPIIVNGKHIANLFAGQFIYDELNSANLEHFRLQSLKWGFDQGAYLEKLKQVPVIPKKRVRPLLRYLKLFAELLGDMGYSRLKTIDGDKALAKSYAALKRETEQRYIEAEKMKQILDANPIPTFVLDREGKISHWNRACETLTGMAAAEMIGTNRHQDAFYSKHRRVMADFILKDASAEGMLSQYDGRIRISRQIEDGYEGDDFFPKFGKWLHLNAAPLHDADGNILGVIETMQDITDRKNMVQDLDARKKELNEQTQYLESVNQALKASLDHREIEKRSVEQSILANMKRFVFPYIDALGKYSDADAKAYLNIIRTNLENIVAQFSTTIFSKYLDFTPTEIRIADLIREGQSSKEIANLMGLSPSSVQWHRKNIREKLGLTNKKINLYTYLTSLQE